ncbi:unnamed protein product, partial [Musa acuminata subsp. burmannicoides]
WRILTWLFGPGRHCSSSSSFYSASLSVATASDPDATVTVGGISDAEGAPNALLEFARVVKAREQVVVGTLHHLTIEVIDAGKKKIYEAKVWIKPWLNFKELQEFRHAGDS